MISLIINILLIILCIKLLPYSIQLGLYCYYLQLLRIEKRLRTCHTAPKKSIANEGARKMLEKVEKLYLQNPNLAYALSATPPDVGSVRETLFLAWLKPFLSVTSSPISDIVGSESIMASCSSNHLAIFATTVSP